MKIFRICLHSFVLAVVNVGFVLVGFRLNKLLSHQIAIQAPVSAVSCIVLFGIWNLYIQRSSFKKFLVHERDEFVYIYFVTLLWSPTIFGLIHAIRWGYVASIEDLLALWFFQLFINPIVLFLMNRFFLYENELPKKVSTRSDIRREEAEKDIYTVKGKYILYKSRKIYLSFAIMLLNTLVLFLFINIVLGMFYSIKDVVYTHKKVGNLEKYFNEDGSPVDNGKRSDYQLKWFDYNAYEGIDQYYAAEVLNDFYDLSKLGFIYQPWVQFSEPPFIGKRVNVDVDIKGFPVRRTINPQNNDGLPVVRIFTIGGSTTFGYNVSDEHTWPSALSKILNEKAEVENLNIHIEVTNYGRGFYYPSQETVLIFDLLKSGHRPNLIIFMDGVNWGLASDEPYFSVKFEQNFKNMQFVPEMTTKLMIEKLKWIPIIRLAYSIQEQILRNKEPNNPTEKLKTTLSEGEKNGRIKDLVKSQINLFEKNREISTRICNLYSVNTLFFLQPHFGYRYNVKLFRPSLHATVLESGVTTCQFYQEMHSQKGIIFLAHLFELWGPDRKAIIDGCHYSPGFNHFLAQHVANYIDIHKLTTGNVFIGDAATTRVLEVWK